MSPISLQLVVLSTFAFVVIVPHVHTLMLTSTIQYRARVHSFKGKETHMANKHRNPPVLISSDRINGCKTLTSSNLNSHGMTDIIEFVGNL